MHFLFLVKAIQQALFLGFFGSHISFRSVHRYSLPDFGHWIYSISFISGETWSGIDGITIRQTHYVASRLTKQDLISCLVLFVSHLSGIEFCSLDVTTLCSPLIRFMTCQFKQLIENALVWKVPHSHAKSILYL